MRYGASFSALLHGIMVALIVFGLPSILKSERREFVPIPVEVVSADAIVKKKKKNTNKVRPLKKKSTKRKVNVKRSIRKPKSTRAEPLPSPRMKPSPKKALNQSGPRKKPVARQVEKKILAKSPRSPKPRRKPRPPEDKFASLLKNLTKKRQENGQQSTNIREKIDLKRYSKPKQITLSDRLIGDKLVVAINQQIYPCWRIRAGARDAANMAVKVNIRLNPDGSLGRQPIVSDTSRMARDGFFRAMAENALRALRDPRCMPLKLPYKHYATWKEIDFTFDPKKALGQ